MNLKTRRLLFLFFAAVFIIVSAYLVLTAQGMVLDLKHLQIVKTGGLFLKHSPADAEIRLNGKKTSGSSGLFETGSLIRNLSPGEYEIEVSKPGFRPWRKTLSVKSGLITSVSQIKLWPVTPETEKINEKTENFYLTEKGLIFRDEENKLLFNNEVILRGNDILLGGPNSKFVVTKDNNNFFLFDLDDPSSATNLSQLFNSLKQRQLLLQGVVPIKKVLFHPFTPQKILISTQNSLYALDFKKLSLERLAFSEKIDDFAVSGSEVVLWDGENLNVINLLLKIRSSYPLVGPKNLNLIVGRGGRIIFLNESYKLYLYNRNAATSTLLDDGVFTAVLSPEEKRLAIAKTDGSLQVLYLDDYQSDIEYKVFTKNIILPAGDENKLENVTWLPKTNHFIGLRGGNLWVTELDTRDGLNAEDIAEDVANYAISGNDLYFLKAGEVLKTSL
ncbi:MAG: hypothetical protein UY26_C0002G0022 [Candidatus Jorgensenbacteria bacterium GW2011_GWA1_48_13]|uniref:PEGA domain-containing protein n=2 Tax=Candidatus Joergenseniibacteriota TaxID=1752739 RepID=A0A0G1W9P2_9BACT|nr:MAG: hypothetical protein UY26_C0002G0022 [Candidatus Jorgensenbacteria bacterium GW2011_GWA1_48_13]KKU99102.1 MAG: hypothetical protein UY32_C0006G0018 [Candidatus Jorgensenbacteria bacterium GW2011_GWC1_48_8]KKW15488.1 MAG: hypothetical protein UY55_C0001G0242 [Candidatus Jorgensenbacteria bacterium GW2011_GWB1_50_10]